jgi:hypothetical protein
MAFGVETILRMTLDAPPEPSSSQLPARGAAEHHVDLGARLGEREVAWPKAELQVVGLEEGADECKINRLQVLEADVLADPQSLDLMEHGNVRRVVVDAVGAAGNDDADLGDRQPGGDRIRVPCGVRPHTSPASARCAGAGSASGLRRPFRST